MAWEHVVLFNRVVIEINHSIPQPQSSFIDSTEKAQGNKKVNCGPFCIGEHQHIIDPATPELRGDLGEC